MSEVIRNAEPYSPKKNKQSLFQKGVRVGIWLAFNKIKKKDNKDNNKIEPITGLSKEETDLLNDFVKEVAEDGKIDKEEMKHIKKIVKPKKNKEEQVKPKKNKKKKNKKEKIRNAEEEEIIRNAEPIMDEKLKKQQTRNMYLKAKKFSCDVCKTKPQTKADYNKHLKSKRHLENLKKK